MITCLLLFPTKIILTYFHIFLAIINEVPLGNFKVENKVPFVKNKVLNEVPLGSKRLLMNTHCEV